MDYLQQIQAGGGEIIEHTARSLRAFKRLAAKLRITLIIVTQVRGMPRALGSKFVQYVRLPDLSVFMEEADTVLLLHQDGLSDPDSPRLGEADLIIAKNRNGPRVIITLAAQTHFCRFFDMGLMD